MRIVIRCDGDSQIGIGHAMRCLAVAEALKDNSDEVLFVSCSLVEGIRQRFHAEGFEWRLLEGRAGTKADAEQVVAIAREIQASWVITDGYVFSGVYQRIITRNDLRLACIDDLATAEFVADLVLNQNPGFSADQYQVGLSTRLLLGMKYILLRREFRDRCPRRQPRKLNNILLTMGGADPDNVTAKILEALSGLVGVKITALLGPANKDVEMIKKNFGSNIEIVVDAENVGFYMERADLAIHAAGSTSWELAHLGVPSISIVLSNDQIPISEELEKSGFSCNLGRREEFSSKRLKEIILMYVNQPQLLEKMSDAGRRLVDGRGVQRVIAELNR